MVDTREPNMMESGTLAPPDVDKARFNSKSTRRSRFVPLGVLGLAVVALTIGLSVGLTRNKDDKATTNSAATVLTTTSTGTTTTGKAPTTAPIDWTSTGTASTTTSTGSTTTATSSSATPYTTSVGSMNATMKLFNPNITIPYSDNDELKADLTEAAKLLVINIIRSYTDQQFIGYGYYDSFKYFYETDDSYYDGNYNGTDDFYYSGNRTEDYVMSKGENVGPANSTTTSAGGDKAQFAIKRSREVPVLSTSKTTSTFRTNNQEAKVEGADLVQSDGTFLYAAYGDVLLAWDMKSGKIVANITMPAIVQTSDNIVYNMTGEVIAGNDNATNSTTNQNISSDDTLNIHSDLYSGNNKPYIQIQSLLLTDNRLAVVISKSDGSSFQYANPNVKPKIIHGYLAIRIQVYDTSDLATNGGKLKLLNETDINGIFYDCRVVGSNVHLVTMATLDTYISLIAPLSKWQPYFMQLSNDEYVVAAIKLAEEKLIPTFVDQLVEDVFSNGKIDLARVNLLQSQISNSTDMDQYMYGEGLLNFLMQVVSFDLSDTLSKNLTLSLAGAFQSTKLCTIYATEETLFVIGEIFNSNLLLGGSTKTTYLLGFKLDGATSTPYAVGSFDGYLEDQDSADIHNGYMRLATTVDMILPINESKTSEFNQNHGIPVQNLITIFEIPSIVNDTLGELKVVGQTESFGKEGNVDSSIQFIDDFAYWVPFKVSDPFYVVNLTDPLNPKSVSVLENVVGFSSYLYSMNSANTLMLAVGDEKKTPYGIPFGFQITLFDASNPIKPVTLQSYSVQTDKLGYTYSEAQWDFKSFRYLSLGDDSGIVIIPVTVTGGRNKSDPMSSFEPLVFDGFVAFDVSKKGITERIRISHVNSTYLTGCYSITNLPARSFAYAGDIMTLKGHSVVSTNLDTGDRKWSLTLLTPEDSIPC